MNCPNCQYQLHEFGCTVENRPLHWCPACGTIRTCGGDIATPTINDKADDTVLGYALHRLAADQSVWSQATFGIDMIRGPVGALKHLAKEAGEAAAAWRAEPWNAADVCEEFADCLLLLLDAGRRAGLRPIDLVSSAAEKMVKNKARTWPTPTTDEPVEHVREATPAEPAPAKPPEFAWGRPPSGSRSFHIFYDSRSLCGSWLFSGADQPITGTGHIDRGVADCKRCVDRFNAHHQTKKAAT